MTPFEALLVVQDRDTELDQLRHRRGTHPARASLADVERELAELEASAAEVGGQRDQLERRRADLEAEVTDLGARLEGLDRRMRSGEVTATRELTAMLEQSDALKRRRADLEDAELELMVAEEPLDESLAELDQRRGILVAQAGALRSELAAAEASIDAELGAVIEARAAAVAVVPDQLVASYERLRARLGGIGAARLVGASCGGCHLTLPATELDRIRREPPDALVTCEQCGRILVR